MADLLHSQIQLVTNRLALNPLHAYDAEFILSLLNTEGWLRFIGDRNVHSVSEAEAYVQGIISNPGIVYWVVRSKDQNTPLGIITLIKRKDLAHPDIGFAFLPAAANKGYAFEACSAVLGHILANNDIVVLNAITNPENTASVHLLRKLGFAFAGEQIIGNDIVHVYSADADKILISLVVHFFFSAFSNKHGQPNLSSLGEICLPEVLVISKQREKTDVMSFEAFIAPREKLLTDGSLIGFEEKEILEETKIIGDIAQRYSKYQKKGVLEGEPFETYGHKFFQFVKTGQSWKISSVVWTDE